MSTLYLIPKKTKADKKKNRQTLQLAEAIKSKRVAELPNGEFGFNAAYKLNINFLDYYRMMCEKRHGNSESRVIGGIGIAALNILNDIANRQ